jgi:hypothetical protein
VKTSSGRGSESRKIPPGILAGVVGDIVVAMQHSFQQKRKPRSVSIDREGHGKRLPFTPR